MSLAPHHAELREAVRRFARERLAPNAPAWDRAGMGATALAIACEEVSAGDGATCTIVMVTNLVANILHGYGDDAQREAFLRPVARGEMLGAFALTEPHVGSDAGAIITRAEKQGGHYVLNGVKQFITSGKTADLAIVFAVTDKAAGKRGISAFIVPTATPGYQVARLEDKTGQRASDTAQIVLENCRVPAANRLDEEGVGYRIALANLESGRINVAAQATGMAGAALEAALAYSHERRSMGKTLFEQQGVKCRLGDVGAGVGAAGGLYVEAARLGDGGGGWVEGGG